jgi:protein ImuB
MKRILCLKFPLWPLQRLVIARPELREGVSTRAIAIHFRDARRGDLVRLASAHARRCGVRPGMPLAEATALFRNERELFVTAENPVADLKLLAKIAAWCERYSPLVGWETVFGGRKNQLHVLPPAAPPEALYLDITGIGSLFGGEAALACDLLKEVNRRGFSARIGIAETIGAAWAVAGRISNLPGNTRESPISRSNQRSAIRNPSSVAIVPRDQVEEALRPLPIKALRLSDDNLATLHELGVDAIEQLLALPRRGLSSRFGPGLLLRIDQALGQAAELIQPHRARPVFQAEWLLEHPTPRREQVEAILDQLVQRVAEQLSQQGKGATLLECRLDVAGRGPLCFTVGLYRPTASATHFSELLRLQLNRLRLCSAVGRVGLSALHTSPLETHQAQLFDDLSLRSARAQARFLDRLSSRLGAAAVVRPLLGERRAMARNAIRNPRTAIPPPNAEVLSIKSARPLRLLAPPQEIDTTALAPDGPPIRLHYRRQALLVVRHWGPERIERHWWRGRSMRRDYYRVETASGQRFWLFRELRQGRWFLHGVFE